MSKIYHFFKNISKPILDENTFCKIWDFLDHWIFNNVWIVTLIIIFLGVTFEIVLIRTFEFFKKKFELWENDSSCSQKNEDIFPKGLTYATESWSISRTSSMERVATFSRSIPSSLPSEEITSNTLERALSSDECEYQRSPFCESHASSGGTNTPLSMFPSNVKNIFTNSFHRKDPPSEYQTVQFPSNNLCSTVKTNGIQTSLPDALNLQYAFQFTSAKDRHVAPPPPVHVLFSSDQIRHVEENIRRKILVNPKARSWREAECLHPRAQEPSIHSHDSHNEGVIPGEARIAFPDQSAMQNQLIHEAQCTRQTQPFIHERDSDSSQPGFSEPAYFPRPLFSSSAQTSVQAQQIDHEDKGQHFNHTPCIVETEYSAKGIESAEHFNKTHSSVYFNEQNKSNHLGKGQNSVFQNAEFLSLNSNLLAEALAHQKVAPGQQPRASLESNQYDASCSMPFSPTIKRERNGRKTPGNERKLGLRVLPPKAKQTSPSRVFPIAVCRTSENKTELRRKKAKRAHGRKIMSARAFHLISVSKLITPHDKKYFSKCLVAVIPDLIKCDHFLQKSLDTENINYTHSNDTVRLDTMENTERSFLVNTPELAAPCSSDLNIPKREGFSGVMAASARQNASLPQLESNREMKVQKDIQNTENGEKLAVGTPDIQKCFSKDSIQNAQNSGEIILNFPGINLLISLGSQKHEENEFKDINVQVITESINLKEEKPLTTNMIEYGNPSESEKPESDTRSNKTNRHQDERMADPYHNTTQATMSQLFDMKMGNQLEASVETLTNCSDTALKPEELRDEEKIQEVKHIDKSAVLRKPQESGSDEEEKETVRLRAEDFRVSVCLTQKDKCAQFEMGLLPSGKRKTQSPKKEGQSQTTSTQTVWETDPCPLTNPLQVAQVKQRTDKPPDRDKAASPVHPAFMPQNSPAGECLIETIGHKAPFCGKPTKTPAGHITEDKENLQRDLCAVATGPFKVRRKSSGPKNVLSVKHKIINVKKAAFSSRLSITARDTLNHKRKVGHSFEILIKQTLHDVTVAPVLLNVHPQGSSLHRNKTNIKLTLQKTQVEKKEKNLDSLNKESKTVDTLKVQLCHGVKLVEQVLPETVAHIKRNHRFGLREHPVKAMEKELFQGVSSTEAIRELRMDSFCVASTKTGTWEELQYSSELELGPATSGELLMGDPLIQSRERNVPSSKNDTREISCGFTQKGFSCSLNYCMPMLTHSKKKKSQTRFTNKSTVRLKYMNKVKPPASKTLSTTGNKKNPKLDLKTKLERINHAKSFLLESQNSLCLFIDSRLQGGFCHAQLKQELASKICVDSVVESRTFYNREKKLQEKQEPFVQAAPWLDQHRWADADQRKDTLLDEPGPSPISLSQEQPANRQGVKCQEDSLQSALEDTLQTAPIQAEGFQKTIKTESGVNFPVLPKNLSPEAGNSSPGEFTAIADNDLESDEKSEHELDLYPVGKDSVSSRSLQETFLQSSNSVTRSLASRRKEKKQALRSKKQTTVNHKYRATREIKTSDSPTVNFRYSNKLNHVEMNDLRQRGSIAGAFLEIFRSKAYILSNKKRRKSKSWAGKQKIRRLGYKQQMREKSPGGGNAQCLASADVSSFPSMKNDEEKGKEEPERFLITQKSPPLILDVHHEKDRGLVQSDTQLNQVGRTITQVQPQTPTEVASCSALCPIPDEFQLEKLEDGALSERGRDPSGDRRHKGQAADSEEAQEPPASYTNPKQSGEKKWDPAKMNGRHQEKKLAAETSSLTNAALDISTSSKIDSETGTPSEKTPCLIQWNPEAEILLRKGRVPLDDIKKIDLQDKEEKENDDTLLKPFSQYSRDFEYCPHQSRDPNSQKLRKQREKNILLIVEQDIPQQSPSAELTRRECAVCTSSPKVPPLQPEESQRDEVSTDRAKYDLPADGAHAQKPNSWDRLEREGLKSDLQATITESSNLSPPEGLRSKRKSKVSPCKALQGKMCSTGVTMKTRKAFVSKVFTIPQCGHRNNLLPKASKSLVSELLIQSTVLPDALKIIILKNSAAEKNKRSLTQELAATVLGSLSFSTPTSKERENLEIPDKGNEMINSSLTVKTRNEATSQTLTAAGCGTPKQSKPMAGSSLNVISPMPVSLDLNTCDGIKDRDLWSTMGLNCELLDGSVHKEKAWCTHYMDNDATSNGTEDVQGQGGEEDPLTFQHFSFSAQNITEPNSTQSGLQQINSATYPELERTLYNRQAQPVNVNTPQSGTVSVRSPLVNTEEPEIGSIPWDNTCDEGPRRKCDYVISEQKPWAEKDLTSLKPLQEPSPVSSESKCEGYTLEFSGKKYISSKARQASRLLHTARHYTRVQRKTRHHKAKYKLKRDKCVLEALLHAVEDAESCPLRLPTDELSLDTAAKVAFSSRIPQSSNAAEKAELQASLPTTFSRTFDVFIPDFSGFKSQVDTVKLSENEILLNRRFSAMKKKKTAVSKIIKIDGHFITNHKKFKLRAKMKAIWLSENRTGVFQNIIHFLLTNSNVENPFKTEVGLRVSKSTHTQPTHGASPVKGIAECDDSVDKVGSIFLKDANVHVGQCWGEKQEVLIEPDPSYTKNLTASAHLMKKPSLEESKGILFREYLPQKSQTYEANPEINVKIENSSMQVSLKEALLDTERAHNRPGVSESASDTTKHGEKHTDQSSSKEKSSFYLTEIVTSVARHLIASKGFKRRVGGIRRLNLSIPKGIPSQMKGPMESQSPRGAHAAVNIKETQDSRTLEIKVDNGEVNTDMKSICTYIPIQQINMGSSQNVWDMYEKSSKGNGLDKAQMKRKEEFAQLPFGADQKRQPGPFESDVPSANTVHCKDIMLQKTAIYLIDQEGNAKVGEAFNQEVLLSSNTHTLQIERQNSEFKTDWKTKSKSFALPKNQEKPNVLGPTWGSYASDTTYPETIRQKDKAKIANVKTTVWAKQIKLKAKKMPVPLLLRHGDSSNEKDLGRSTQHQHQNALELRRNVQNLVLKANLGLECFISPVTKLTSVKLEKGKLGRRKNTLPQNIMEKPSDQRQKSGSGCVDVPRKLEENIKEEHDDCTFKDIHPQFMQRFGVKSEEIKEHHSCEFDNLQRKTNSELTLQKDETDHFGLPTSRNRGGTKVYIGPQDSLQQDYPLKQGMILQTMKDFLHCRTTNKFIKKRDIKTSSPQMMGEMEVMENPLDPKEALLIPRLLVQPPNMVTDPLPGSIPSQVPCQPHTEEPKENMKINDKLLKNSTPPLKKASDAEYISDMDHVPGSIEELLLLKEQEKGRKRSRGGKNFETAEDIKATMKNPTPFPNNSPPRTQFINTTNSGVFGQRDGTEPKRSVATLWTQQRLCVQGTSLDFVFTQELTSKAIRHHKRRAAFTDGVLYHKTLKMKLRKTTSGKLLSVTRYGAHSYRKEPRHSIKTQKEVPQGKTVADLLWKDSGYTATQIKKLREVKEGKGKPQRPLNGTNLISMQSTDNNSTSSTIRKSEQYTMTPKEHQVFLLDITPQNEVQLMPGQQVEDPRHINLSAHLEKEAYRVVFPETEETDSSRLEAQRPRADTECEFSTAQRVEQGVMKDSIKHALSVPPRRGGPEKMNISSSKEHDVFLIELDTFQKETCKVQELLKQGESSPPAGLENVACPVRGPFHLESTKVAKEVGMDHNVSNISHLFGLRETDPELDSKAQAFLCPDLENLYKTGTALRGHAKSGHRPRILLNSVLCHKRAPRHSKPRSSTTRKDSGASAVGAKMNLRSKGRAESTASPLKLNRQKVDISKKIRAKHLTIFAQNKEQIVEFFLYCILYKLQTENAQKEISAKAALDSKIFNPALEKSASEVKILGRHSPSSEGVNLQAKGGAEHPEDTCEPIPASGTHSLMDMHQITSPQVEKELKTVDSLDYHALNTEKEEHNNRTKEQNHCHLSFSLKNLEEHLSCSQNDSYVQPHLEPHTKEALLKVGNVSSEAKGPDLSSKAHRSTGCECRPEWILPSVILEQTKEQDPELPLESGSKTIKCPSLLSSKKKSADGVQISKLASNDSSSMPTVGKKELLHRASQKKQEGCLPNVSLHCLSLCLQFFHENEKQKGNTEHRGMNDTICPERKTLNSEKSVHPHISPNDYTPSNNSELHCYKKEKIICVKHRKGKPGSVVIKAREYIPLPPLKLDKEKSDVLISSDVRQEKHKSQEENGIKGTDTKGIMDSNITFKTEKLSLSYPFSGNKLTLLFDSIERQGKVREGLSKSDVKLKNSCILLPPLLHFHLNSRIKVEKDKSEQLKSCLPPLKPSLSVSGRKVPFSKAFSGAKSCKLTELKDAPQRKEYRNIVDLKDRVGLIGIARKGKTSPLKYLPHGKEKWRNNKKEPTQEEEKNTVRKDARDKKIPKLTDQNVRKLARSHALSIKELQRETRKEKLMNQINKVVALSVSQLQLNTFPGAQRVNREVYNEIKLLKEHVTQKEKGGREKDGDVNSIMHAEDIYSKTKKSPTLLMQNFSDLQGKTREQEGETEEDGSKPGVTLTQKSPKTSVATSPLPTLTVSARIKKERTTVLTRSSVSLGYVQNSLVSEGGICIRQIPGDTSISLQHKKQHMSQEKEEAGIQIAKFVTTHTYQETMVQELKNEQVLELTKSSPLLPDQSHPKLPEKLEFNDPKLSLRNSALQRSSTKGETVPREAIVGDTMKDVKKQHISQREETYPKEIIDRRGVDVTLKVQNLLLSQRLYRTELHMHINAPKPKEDSKSEPRGLRKMHTSQPSPTNILLHKGVQVDEERLKSTLSSPDAEEIVDKEAKCGHVRKGKQYKKQIKITGGLTAGLHCERTKVSPISHLLNTKEIVLNMKFLEKKVHNGKSEQAVVATRSFLSLPSLPSEYSQDKTQRGTARGTGVSYPQGNCQEAADAREPATKESAAVESDCIVKTREYNVLQKPKSVTSVHQISEDPQVEMENESDPQDHKIHLTRLGTIKKEIMLSMSFEGQKGQPEKCEKEPSTKIGHWKKENEFKDNLSNKTSSKFSVSPTNISRKEALVTSNALVCSKPSVAERKQETGSGSSMTSEKGRQSNASLSKMLTPAKMSQNKEEQNVNVEEQAVPQSKSGQMIEPKSSLPNVPVHSKNQRIPLQTDTDKKTTVSINPQTQSGVDMCTTEFNATRRKEDSPSIVPEQEQCDRALPQKSHESPLETEHLEETSAASDENLKQTKLEMDSNASASQKEGAVNAGGSGGVALEEDRRETHQSCIVRLENKAREHTSTTTSHALPPATEEPEIETQVGTSRENGYPPQEKLKRELELPTAKQNIQGQRLLQTSTPNSLYVDVPDCPNCQKSRFAETNLKRELKPKYLTMRIPKYPISKTLGIIGCDNSSRKRKFKYAFNKPKTMVPSSKCAAGIIVRSLCVSMISPPHDEGTVELETNPSREKRVCHSEFQKKLSDARGTKDILTGVKELSKLRMHLVSKATEIKLSHIPEIVIISCQKCNSQPQRTISEDYSGRLYLKHTKMNFTSPKAGSIHDNLESNYQRDFPPFSGVKTTNVSNSSEVMTEAKGIKKQESVTSLETRSHILQKFSEKGRDNLLLHFGTKALEIKTTSLPRIATQSYAMASDQHKSKPLFTCIHSATKGQKQMNRVLVLFDEKSFCKIDCDLQRKYLRSIPGPSVPLASKANVLPKLTYKLGVGLGSECKTVEDREESSRLLFDTDLLQHVPFQKKNPQESSFFTRKVQETPHELAFSAGRQGTEQNDMIIPSELKLQMTPEKDKQCRVCFQESSLYKHYKISGTQQNSADLASSHSSWISDDWTNDGPLNTETSSDLEECPASDLAERPASDLAESPASDLAECPASDLAECPASEESDSEECVFIGNNFYLTQGSQKFLFEVPKAISLANFHRVDGATLLKSVYRDDPNDHHTRTHRKHTSPVEQPCYQSRNSTKHRLNSKMQSPDGLCYSPSNIVEIESTTSSITFNEDKHQTMTTWSRTSYSLTSSATESNTKLNFVKKYGKSYVYPQVKERRKAKSDLWRKFNVDQSSNYSHSHSGEKHARRKRLYHYESEEPNPPNNRMPEPSAHQQNIKFYPERREKQPFFYACVPADSMDVIPQTIRWLIPSKILKKSNFHIPQVANISKSWNLCSSSRKLLGSLAGAFNTVRHC